MRTFIRISAVALLLTMILPLSVGCGKAPESRTETVVVTDMVGDRVTVPKNPRRVACVSRTTYDLLIAFGLGDKIDGAYKSMLKNPWTALIYPQSKGHFSYGYTDGYETFLSRGVDLVFAPERYIAEDLREHGVNAVCVSLYGTPRFDEYVTFFSNLVTEIWDSEEVKQKAAAWNERVGKAVTDIQTELAKHQLPKRKVFYVRGDKDKGVGYTDTTCSFTEYAYRVLGFDYVGSGMETPNPSVEEVIASNPDIFVCGGIYQNRNAEALRKPPFAELEAVRNGRIYGIPVGLTPFEQLSAMTPIFFYDQANKIYPEYFHYNIPDMVRETVREYFGTELTDTQIDRMLRGLDADGHSPVK